MTGDRLLCVDADLVIEIGGQQLFLKGSGSAIVLELPSLALAIKIVRDLGSLRAAGARLSATSSAIKAVGLTVIVRKPRRRLMTIGQGGDSWLLRLFGFANVQFHVS